jgi:hypothetical protein
MRILCIKLDIKQDYITAVSSVITGVLTITGYNTADEYVSAVGIT